MQERPHPPPPGETILTPIISQAYVSCITDEKTVTITLPNCDEDRFRARLATAKITTGHNGLNGCFHHARHSNAAELLKELYASAPHLQLPSAERLNLPLRSTADASLVAAGALHDVAIDAILSKRAHWYQTVRATMDDLPSGRAVEFVAFGKKESLVPAR